MSPKREMQATAFSLHLEHPQDGCEAAWYKGHVFQSGNRLPIGWRVE